MTIVNGCFYFVTTDNNFKDLQLTKADILGASPSVTPLATIPFVARGIAFDGVRFWTGDRGTNEIVAFELPA